MQQEYIYWMALAHVERMRTLRKNEIVVHCYERSLSLSDFFQGEPAWWMEEFGLAAEEAEWVEIAKNELSNYSFLAEDLLEQGYELIPIISPDYPKTLKLNLKKTYAPPLLYVKGNSQLLQAACVAIVGSRSASDLALQFADNVAQKAVEEGKAVVSGYAKGVDKQALDSALKYGGSSIVVLPQGIATFASGIKALYRELVSGRVVTVSAFHPKAPWSAGLAMARNPIIYGMADEIFVAESDSKGGTWSGVVDGLRKKRRIYVRESLPAEKNANHLLIEKGAFPVSLQGEILVREKGISSNTDETASEEEGLEQKIRLLLKGTKLTSKEILERLSLEWPSRKMTDYLKNMPDIETQGRSPKKFTLKGTGAEPTLFG